MAKLLGAINGKFRCARCKSLYRTQAKLVAHNCPDKTHFGTLATFIANGQLSIGDAAKIVTGETTVAAMIQKSHD